MNEIVSRSEPFRLRQFGSTIKAQWVGLLSLLALMAAAIAAYLVGTASGLGVSPDSVSYLSMAANLRQGLGFVSDLVNPFDANPVSPVTLWPPGYSLLVAGPMLLGVPVQQSARVVNLLCLVATIGAVYWLGRRLASPWVGILSGAVLLAMMPVLRMATFALSEMAFSLLVCLTVVCFCQVPHAPEGRRWIWIGLAGVSSALAILTRYVGLFLIVAGLIALGITIAKERRGNTFGGWFRAVWLPAMQYSVLALAPSLPWFLRNWMLTGNFSGSNRLVGYHPTLIQNVRFEIGTLAQEFLPSIHLGLRGTIGNLNGKMLIAVLLVLIGVGAFFWIHQRRASRRLGRRAPRAIRPSVAVNWSAGWVVLAFAGCYLVCAPLIASVVYFPDYDWPRLLVSIYPLLVLIGVSFWWFAVKMNANQRSAGFRQGIFWVPIAILVMLYAVQSMGFVSLAAQGQELTAKAWRENQGIAWLARIAGPNDVIYSDRPEAAAYFLNRSAKYLPYQSDFSRFSQNLATNQPAAGSSIYLIVFKGDLGQSDPYFAARVSGSDLQTLTAEMPNLKVAADLSDATIYQIRG